MLLYALQRSALAVLILVTAMVMLFAALYVIPGDPAALMLGTRATPELRARVAAEFGLDQPLAAQVVQFFGRLLQGDLGTDIWSRRPVGQMVAEALPHTLVLIAAGIGWAALVGIPLGCYSAIRRGSLIDRVTGILSVATISIPSFVVAIYAILFFSIQLDLLPVIGAGQPGDLASQARALILPAFAIGLGWVGYLARIVRASMLEVMGENHIRTARANGLGELRIVFFYALRIAILPTITLLAMSVGSLLSGAVFVEAVFNRPGLGKLIVDATAMRNLPVVQGGVLAVVAIYAVVMPVSDLIVAWLDPRVRARL